MRNVVLQMGISIDGKMSGGPEKDIGGGEAEHPDVVARKMAWISQAGLHAMGRTRGCPASGPGPPSSTPKPMNGIPKVVFSKTLTRADWPTTTIVVALGSGELMFKDLPVQRRLQVAEVTSYPDGTVISIYCRPS